MRSRMVAVAAAALLVTMATTSCRWLDGDSETASNVGADVSPAKRGEEVFYKHCAVCHSADTAEAIVGPSLKGFFSSQSPPPLADGTVLPRTDAAVRELFAKGTMNMPPVKGLSEQQLDEVIAFLHTL